METNLEKVYIRAFDQTGTAYYFNIQTRTSTWTPPPSDDDSVIIVDVASSPQSPGTSASNESSKKRNETSTISKLEDSASRNTIPPLQESDGSKNAHSDASLYGWSHLRNELHKLHEEDVVTPLSGVAAAVAQGHAGLTSLRRILGTLALPKSEESTNLVEAASLHDHQVPEEALKHQHVPHLLYAMRDAVSKAQQQQHEVAAANGTDVNLKATDRVALKPSAFLSTDGYSFFANKVKVAAKSNSSSVNQQTPNYFHNSGIDALPSIQRLRPRVTVAPLQSPTKVVVEEKETIEVVAPAELQQQSQTFPQLESSRFGDSANAGSVSAPALIVVPTRVFGSAFDSSLTTFETATNSSIPIVTNQQITSNTQIMRSITPPRPIPIDDISKFETSSSSSPLSPKQQQASTLTSGDTAPVPNVSATLLASPSRKNFEAAAEAIVQSKRDYSDAKFFSYFGGSSNKVLVEHDAPKLHKHTKGSVTDEDLKRILRDLEEKAKTRPPPMLAQVVANLLSKH